MVKLVCAGGLPQMVWTQGQGLQGLSV